MLQKRRSVLLGAVTLAGVMVIIVVRVIMGSQAVPLAAEALSGPDPSPQEASDGIESPAISQIISASPTCYRPSVGTGACYIEWNNLSVTAAPGGYVISMTVSIDDSLRAYHAGFFQSSMVIPNDLTPAGYKVTCGAPGSAGTAGWGRSYRYVIRARDTTGLAAANYGTVSCPADVPNVYLPLLVRAC